MKFLQDAIAKYEEFHSFEPEDVGSFHPSLRIPKRIARAGRALWVAYRSNKWEKKFHSYIHEHGKNVFCHRPELRRNVVAVPAYAFEDNTLTKLGDCLGFCYRDDAGVDTEAAVGKPKPELYCTSNGRCLLVIQGKRRLVAMIWGGKLAVEDVGIVG